MELMKKNQAVYLCVDGDVWYRVCFYTYGEGEDFFKFMNDVTWHKRPPVTRTRAGH